jgi:hypothetical protein
MTQDEKKKILNIGWHQKTVFKLDHNFHVYVHGGKSKIDVDEDAKGKYLKLYFEKIR